MQYIDAHEITNQLVKEMLGETGVTNTDAGSLTEIGAALEKKVGTEQLFKAIVDKTGKTEVLNKAYRGKFSELMTDGWTFGSILETLRIKPMVATKDPSVNPEAGNYPLTDYKPETVKSTYYNKYDNFQVEAWHPTDQLWGSFNDASTQDKFLNGLMLEQANGLGRHKEALARAAVINYIGQVAYKNASAGNYGAVSTPNFVNVLKEYKAEHPDATITAATCMNDEDFKLFLIKRMNNTFDYMTDESTVFNIDGEVEQTYAEDIKTVMLSNVKNDIDISLKTKLFNENLAKIPGNLMTVSYWQGSNGYGDEQVGEINVKIEVDEGGSKVKKDVNLTGVLAVMYDPMAVRIACEKNKTTTFYHPDLDQIKYMNKYRAMYLNDFSKNFVVFYVADAA